MMSIAGIAVDILFLLAFEAKKDRNEKPDANADYLYRLMLLKYLPKKVTTKWTALLLPVFLIILPTNQDSTYLHHHFLQQMG